MVESYQPPEPGFVGGFFSIWFPGLNCFEFHGTLCVFRWFRIKCFYALSWQCASVAGFQFLFSSVLKNLNFRLMGILDNCIGMFHTKIIHWYWQFMKNFCQLLAPRRLRSKLRPSDDWSVKWNREAANLLLQGNYSLAQTTTENLIFVAIQHHPKGIQGYGYSSCCPHDFWKTGDSLTNQNISELNFGICLIFWILKLSSQFIFVVLVFNEQNQIFW